MQTRLYGWMKMTVPCWITNRLWRISNMHQLRNANILEILNVIVICIVLIRIDVKMPDVEDSLEHYVHQTLNVILIKDLFVRLMLILIVLVMEGHTVVNSLVQQDWRRLKTVKSTNNQDSKRLLITVSLNRLSIKSTNNHQFRSCNSCRKRVNRFWSSWTRRKCLRRNVLWGRESDLWYYDRLINYSINIIQIII